MGGARLGGAGLASGATGEAPMVQCCVGHAASRDFAPTNRLNGVHGDGVLHNSQALLPLEPLSVTLCQLRVTNDVSNHLPMTCYDSHCYHAKKTDRNTREREREIYKKERSTRG